MAAAYTLHLNLFSHVHLEPSHILTGIQAATPCLAMEAALLLISSTLPATRKATQPAAAANAPAGVSVVALQEAVESVYLHNMRYSLIGATGGMRRAMLEAGAQLSDDLLARGVLLGCSSAWLASR
jgi:riboflavin biosynthesis pyrimidine reductase